MSKDSELQEKLEQQARQLAAEIGQFTARVHERVDPRAQLRRMGPRVAVGTALLGTLAASTFVMRTTHKSSLSPDAQSLAKKVAKLEKELHKARKGPLWQKLLLRAISTAATAGATSAMERFNAQLKESSARIDQSSRPTHHGASQPGGVSYSRSPEGVATGQRDAETHTVKKRVG